jgi:hypothetical protein
MKQHSFLFSFFVLCFFWGASQSVSALTAEYGGVIYDIDPATGAVTQGGVSAGSIDLSSGMYTNASGTTQDITRVSGVTFNSNDSNNTAIISTTMDGHLWDYQVGMHTAGIDYVNAQSTSDLAAMQAAIEAANAALAKESAGSQTVISYEYNSSGVSYGCINSQNSQITYLSDPTPTPPIPAATLPNNDPKHYGKCNPMYHGQRYVDMLALNNNPLLCSEGKMVNYTIIVPENHEEGLRTVAWACQGHLSPNDECWAKVGGMRPGESPSGNSMIDTQADNSNPSPVIPTPTSQGTTTSAGPYDCEDRPDKPSQMNPTRERYSKNCPSDRALMWDRCRIITATSPSGPEFDPVTLEELAACKWVNDPHSSDPYNDPKYYGKCNPTYDGQTFEDPLALTHNEPVCSVGRITNYTGWTPGKPGIVPWTCRGDLPPVAYCQAKFATIKSRSFVEGPMIDTQADNSNPSPVIPNPTDNNSIPLIQNDSTKPSLTLSTQNQTIQSGGAATINIDAKNVKTCWGYGGDGTDFVSDWLSPSQKTVRVSPSKSSCYIDECWNDEGMSTGAKTIIITVPNTPTPKCQVSYIPTLKFSSSQTDEGYSLRWKTKDVDSCWLYGGDIIPNWTSSVNATISVNPKTSTDYFMKCWSPSGKETGDWQRVSILIEGTGFPAPMTPQKPGITVSSTDTSLTWSASFARFCAVTHDGTTSARSNKSKDSLSIVAGTAHDYSVECWNERGESSGVVEF